MKLIKRVKLKRVRYGDLDEGDEFCAPLLRNGRLNEVMVCDGTWHNIGTWVAIDTTKYPPESVTYDVVGITEELLERFTDLDSDYYEFSYKLAGTMFDESEIETVFE